MLSGLTGLLGFAGGVGSSGSGTGGEAQTTSSSLQQTISPKLDIISGAGARGGVTVNTAFPGAHLSSSADVNNPVEEKLPIKMTLVALGVVVAFVVLIKLAK